MQRRLAAVLAADIVGYSAMMGADEASALEALALLRDEVLEPEVARRRGEVVKRLGDGWLVEFGSVVDAVDCAVAVQEALADEAVALRIGVHIGDIVHRDGDIFGDGVNIAARLEARGAGGHVLISDDARRQIAGNVGAAFHDNGAVALKNIAEEVRVWSWPAPLPGLAARAGRGGRKPAVHVAAFEHRGAGAEDLADGLRDELVTAFSRQTGLTLSTEPERADYLLEGAVRGAGERWRISAHLSDRESGRSVWSERFEEAGADVFAIQDHCVARIAGAVRIRMPGLLAAKAADVPIESMSVEDLLNYAMSHHFYPSRESWDKSAAALRLALERDPDSWMAKTMLCFNIMATGRLFGWRPLTEAAAEEAVALVEEAQRLKPKNDVVHMARGVYLLYVRRDHRAARVDAEEALRLNPDFHHSINLMSLVELYDGDPERARELALRAADCDPAHPYLHIYERGVGLVEAAAGRNEAAIERFMRADRAAPGLPQNLIGLAICRQRGGDADGEAEAVRALLAVAPDFNLAEMDPWPFRDADLWAPFGRALAEAGAPEGPMRDQIRLVT